MSVHATCLKSMKTVPASGPGWGSKPWAPIGDIETAEVVEFEIGADAVLIPDGTNAIVLVETEGTAFRYAVGDADVAVPAAGEAHRWTMYHGPLSVGVTGGQYIKTAGV